MISMYRPKKYAGPKYVRKELTLRPIVNNKIMMIIMETKQSTTFKKMAKSISSSANKCYTNVKLRRQNFFGLQEAT